MKDALEKALLTRPFHRWLGLKALAAEEGRVEIAATFRDEMIVNAEQGYIHGGILAALVDLGADMAFFSKTGHGVPTIDLRVDYHAPARGNLKVVGTVVRSGRRFSTAEASVFDESGRLVASGRGTYLTER